MLPAPGQGSLALECRVDDRETTAIVGRLNDLATRLGIVAERAVLSALHGGCSAPIAAWGRISEDQLVVDGLVATLDGRQVLRGAASIPLSPRESDDQRMAAADLLGRQVAEALREMGAEAIVAAARRA
jgi:hydroxymethylbilane synthase